MRARIYPRFSTDNQDRQSIADQVRVCTAYAEQHGWTVEGYNSDEGISGAAIGNRPGFLAMMADANRRAFDVLIVSDLSRLSRSAGDLNKTIDRLTFLGIRVVAVANGYDSDRKGHKLQAGVEGIMGEAFREMISIKTYDALDGRSGMGLFVGGLAYGYCSEEHPGGRILMIREDQARWVRWIFGRYADGQSVQRIVADLNEQRIPSPRGSTWAVGAIYGSPAKGTGILNNESYIGRIVWNRAQFIKDPDRGIRKRIERPRSDWRVSERPDLRIVEQDLWDAVHMRMKVPTTQGGNTGRGPRPSTLFGGLLRCGICGGAVVAVNATHYGCAARKDRGAVVCAGVLSPRSATDSRLLSLVRDDLLAPEAIAYLQAQVQAILREMAQPDTDREARAKALDAEIARLVDAVARSGGSDALLARLAAAESDRRSLAAVTPAKIGQIPDVMARYRRLLADLPGSLRDTSGETREALRGILGPIRLSRSGPEIWADLDYSPGRVLLAGVDGNGSGGAINELSTPIRIRII